MRLDSYLRQRRLKPWEFAKQSEIPFTTVQRVLEGQWVAMRTADKIVRATGGRVRLEDLVPAPGGGAGV